MASAGGGPIDIVVCEKHGLRYNRAAESGCVRCRRESGAAPSATGARSGAAGPLPAPRPAAPADRPASALLQLLLAACLVGGTGALFWSAHEAVLATFGGGLIGAAGKAGAATAPGSRSFGEPPQPTWPGLGSEPSPPPNGVTVGPAEEQRQMQELMRQMQQEQQRERQQLQQQQQTGEQSPQ